MNIQNISWYMGEEVSEETLSAINSVEEITDLTITRIRIPVEFSEGEMKLRLYNTDPKNWNLFMTPYTSEKVRATVGKEDLLKTVEDPHSFLLQYVEENELDEEYPLPIRFEIKKSQSTGNNTLYIFFQKLISFKEDDFEFERRDLVFRNEDDIKVQITDHAEEYAATTDDTVTRLWHKFSE